MKENELRVKNIVDRIYDIDTEMDSLSGVSELLHSDLTDAIAELTGEEYIEEFWFSKKSCSDSPTERCILGRLSDRSGEVCFFCQKPEEDSEKIKLTEEDLDKLAKTALKHKYSIEGLRRAKEVLDDEIYKVEDRLKYVLARYVGGHELQGDISLGHWECETSPTGQCAYGRNGDDFCLFCGGPDERK